MIVQDAQFEELLKTIQHRPVFLLLNLPDRIIAQCQIFDRSWLTIRTKLLSHQMQRHRGLAVCGSDIQNVPERLWTMIWSMKQVVGVPVSQGSILQIIQLLQPRWNFWNGDDTRTGLRLLFLLLLFAGSLRLAGASCLVRSDDLLSVTGIKFSQSRPEVFAASLVFSIRTRAEHIDDFLVVSHDLNLVSSVTGTARDLGEDVSVCDLIDRDRTVAKKRFPSISDSRFKQMASCNGKAHADFSSMKASFAEECDGHHHKLQVGLRLLSRAFAT